MVGHKIEEKANLTIKKYGKDFDLKKLNGFKELVVHTIAGVTKKEVFEKEVRK